MNNSPASSEKPNVRVGTAVLLQKNGQILLGKRLGSHGEHTWAPPGGHLEFGESWEECASREAKEETALDISNCRFITATNDIFTDAGKHYITLFLTAQCSGEPQLMEPQKCAGWQWFDITDLPSPLFLPILNLLKSQPDFWQKVIPKHND